MRTAFVDYETYWDNDYTLKKMTYAEYFADPRFKVHMMTAAVDQGPVEFIDGTHVQQWWDDVGQHCDATCAHNAAFDAGITHEFYCQKRFFLLDTQSMAQGALAARHPQLTTSLGALARHYWPDNVRMQKIGGVLELSKGVQNLTDVPGLLEQMVVYGKQDTMVMRSLFRKLLAEDYPWHTELHNIHISLAMGVYRSLMLDNALAGGIYAHLLEQKEAAARSMFIARAVLRSNPKFCLELEKLGVEIPMKPSPKDPEKMIPALAKKDPELLALMDHPDPRVGALLELRVGERASQTMNKAKLYARLPARFSFKVAYAKAHTGRHAGEDGNSQNMEKAGDIRRCIRAAPGHLMGVSDLSQIELRMNAWFCNETWVLDALRSGVSLYSKLATEVFGYPVTKKEHEDFEYLVGKTGELQCGYQSGPAKLCWMLKSKKVPGADERMARDLVIAYRLTHSKIVATWKWLQYTVIPVVAGCAGTEDIGWKGVTFTKGRVILPSGRSLWYPGLKYDGDTGEWMYRVNPRLHDGKSWKKLFGGSFLENIIQAMSYDAFMFHCRQMDSEGIYPAGVVHDEVWITERENRIAATMARVAQIQSTSPEWCNDVPLRGEGKTGLTYKDCK